MIVIKGNIQMFLDQDNEQSLFIEATSEAQNKVETKVIDKTLYVSSKSNDIVIANVFIKNLTYIKTQKGASFETLSNITLENLEVEAFDDSRIIIYTTSAELLFTAKGEGDIILSGVIDNLNLYIEGNIEFKSEIYAYVINAVIGDETNAKFIGETDELNANLKDDSYLQAFELKTRECNINSTDYSDACIYAYEVLNFKGEDESSLYFKGFPKNVSKKTMADSIMKSENNKKANLAKN